MHRARGLTLIEVVAALVILAVTTTALTVAHARSLEQLRVLRHQETAAMLAEEWLAARALEDLPAVESSSGTFEHQPGWRWALAGGPWLPDDGGPALVQRSLEIYRARSEAGEELVRRYTWLERPPDVR